MAYNIDFSVASSGQVESALCTRLEGIRLARNVTQVQLAVEAGVSPRTIRRLEKGQGVSLDTFIRVLRALGIQENLVALLPDPSIQPVQRVAGTRTQRKRARPAKPPDEQKLSWRWGDDKVDDE
jgi:putative transcriptional regulator